MCRDPDTRSFVEFVPVSMTGADLRHKAIGMLLAQRAGKTPDAKAIAAAAADTWPRVTARLVPVIGARGVDVLFRRALHLTSSSFPWLRLVGEDGGHITVLESLTTRLAEQEASSAAEASCALLVAFSDLLATLIGESLTERLLGPVWAPPLTAPRQETGK